MAVKAKQTENKTNDPTVIAVKDMRTLLLARVIYIFATQRDPVALDRPRLSAGA
jgi:hypothetical protein